jgi:hypothetical protein
MATAAGEDCGDPLSAAAKSREIVGSDIDESEERGKTSNLLDNRVRTDRSRGCRKRAGAGRKHVPWL